ncbi:hypothetical protein H6794_03715 [Candidatus Nomurabacteria bacterium]|nr:hypothetical protein [Candidatus Saccharibacteria bacterium]MCB9839936.1 hypothetical protein [Candidatus Nomurabacteria bacterium]
MDELQAAGLSQTESKTYRALLAKKEWKPSALAKIVNENRTNMYKILDKLSDLGLASRFDKNNVLHFRATNPTRLLELARMRRAKQQEAEMILESTAQSLIGQFTRVNDQPAVRYYQGKEEIALIYKDMSLTKSEISFIHSSASVNFFSFEVLHNLRMMAVKNKVPRRAITSDGPRAPKDYKEKDPLVYLERTWLGQNEYTAPVEIGVYDSTVYIISFGTEAIGLTIESDQISEAFKQIFGLLSTKQRQTVDYSKLPMKARGKAIIS